jgi:hypothetical protein
MTRNGSLVYYLTAWIVGSFFMILALFVADAIRPPVSIYGFLRNITSNFLFAYFFGLIYGASTELVYGFVLRRFMIWSGATRIWQWVLTGSALVIPFFFILRWMGHILRFTDPGGNLFAILVGGVLADLADDYRILALAVPAGGATSAVLFYVHRAFAEHAEAQRAPSN